jgi:transcription elongation factor Elf1
MMSTQEVRTDGAGEPIGTIVWQAAVEEAELRAEELVQIALQETLEARAARDEAIKELEVVKILVGSERRNGSDEAARIQIGNLQTELHSTRKQVDDLSRLIATQAETIARLRRKHGLLESERAQALAKLELESSGDTSDSEMSVVEPSTPDDMPMESASAPAFAYQQGASYLKHSLPRSKFHRETKPYSPATISHWQGAEGVTHCFNCQTSTTPLWRRDTIGNVLCNACGLYYKVHKSHRPYLAATKTPGARRDRVVTKTDTPRECDHCRTSSTPLWRKDKEGNLNLCNACGLYEKLHGATRPLPDRHQEATDGYRRRKRWQGATTAPR